MRFNKWEDDVFTIQRFTVGKPLFLVVIPRPWTHMLMKYNLGTDFRNDMLNAIKGFGASTQSGLFINSCFAHCQSERQDTWFADDSPLIDNKVHL